MKQLTDEEILSALEEANGFISAAAKRLGCCRWTVTNRLNDNSELKERYKEIVEARVDTAESKLMELVRAGNLKAIMFLLRAKGRQRGYGDEPPSIFAGLEEPDIP